MTFNVNFGFTMQNHYLLLKFILLVWMFQTFGGGVGGWVVFQAETLSSQLPNTFYMD